MPKISKGRPQGYSRSPGYSKQRVTQGKGRANGSTRWLQRQLNDPYVHEAQRLGYRSRAAFKLMQIHERYQLFSRGMRVIDLGAAPGGWTQVVAEWLRNDGAEGRLISLDILPMDPVRGAEFIAGDFRDQNLQRELVQRMAGPADLVLSDLAPNTIGHRQADHLRAMALVEEAALFAGEILAPGGSFLAKLFQGGTEHTLLAQMKRDFSQVRHVKPPASRAESRENYVLAQGFRGNMCAIG